ncbi:MAG TPA: hypothetical protein VGD33_02545 [Chitinophagaceae bacterium]
MNRIFLLLCFSTVAYLASGQKGQKGQPIQKVDSIYFHLYTDSLKKGQHNYINVDGKFSNGTWLPLSQKEIEFTCNEASFEGNELIIPFDFKPRKVKVKAVLRENPAIWKEITIWIKQLPDPKLPTAEDVMQSPSRRKKGKN